MARIRSIKPAFFTSEDTCACSPLARLLFLGLLTEADKAGRLEDRPRQLKRRLLPDDDCDVDALLWELVDHALVSRYQAAGVEIIQVLNFLKHQKPHPKESESQLPASGQEKPRLDPASREQVSMVPVENPSCPRRNGSGDLSNGYGDQEGRGGEPASPPAHNGGRLITSSMDWFKQHGKHADGFCDWLCFPQSSFNRFVNLVIGAGATEAVAIAQVRRWAVEVRRQWTSGERAGLPGSDIFKFWDHEWEATHGSNRPAAGAVNVLAGLL